MKFMNTYDIEDACMRHPINTVRWRAAEVLDHLATQANNVSDGWAYWPKPARAAAKMMGLAEGSAYGPDATEADYRKALAPIKAFYTKWGAKAGMAPLPAFLLEGKPRGQ